MTCITPIEHPMYNPFDERTKYVLSRIVATEQTCGFMAGRCQLDGEITCLPTSRAEATAIPLPALTINDVRSDQGILQPHTSALHLSLPDVVDFGRRHENSMILSWTALRSIDRHRAITLQPCYIFTAALDTRCRVCKESIQGCLYTRPNLESSRSSQLVGNRSELGRISA